MRYTRTLLIATAMLAATATSSQGEDWPHWRGPAHNGISTESGLPLTWSPTENIAWKLDLPEWSGSTPIISGETIFLNVAEGESLWLWAVNRADSAVLWKRHLGDGNHKERKQNMSSPSPVTDGDNVWVMTGTGILKSFDFEGTERWARDIPAEYGAFGLNWGYASSPLLDGNALYVQVLHGMKTDDPSYVLRIDATTGATVWRVERLTAAIRESPDSYTTPALLVHEGRKEIVITGGDDVTGHDTETGAELWRVHGLNPENQGNYRIVASPVVMDGIIYAPTRVSPLLAIRAGGSGNISDSHRLWSFEDGPDVPTPVTDGRYFYSVEDGGQAWCLDAKTGAVIYGPNRLAPGTYSGSPVLADGRIYITNEDGLTSVYKAGPEFEILAENPLEDYNLASPAISEGQIFLRTASALWAIGQRR